MFPLLVLTGVVFTAIAQVFLRMGMQRIGEFDLTLHNIIPIGVQIITSMPIIAGILCYIIGILNWLIILSRMEVSFAYPMMSMGYIVTALIAYYWLGEQLGPLRIAGIMVIMVGVWMISRTA